MKYSKILFFFILFTLFTEASNDRAIYRKQHANENKVALVIGNANYNNFSPLKNTLNDAEDIQNILKEKGFDVLYLKDGDLRSMKKIVRKFAHKLKNGGVGFFYYAGHGVEVNGQNYLIPVNADIPDKTEVEFETLPVNLVIKKMEDSHNRLNIIVLDACRNDPFSSSRALGGGGLAQINNAKGMYIAFATAPGETASDGVNGRNGLFTKHLIDNIKKNGLTLNEVFKQTRISVYNESHEKQLPWTSSSVIGNFYFQLDDTANTSDPIQSSNNSDKENNKNADYAELKQLLKEFMQEKKEDEKKRTAQRQSITTNSTPPTGNGSTLDSYGYKNSSKHYYPYVCYSKKFSTNNGKSFYTGCIRSNKACNNLKKEHFGKYPNDEKAHSAFLRCIKNNPKSTTTEGLYVCYNNKILTQETSIYKGCKRSETPCNTLGKLHFGKYSSKREAKNALLRCQRSNPKFVDSQGL